MDEEGITQGCVDLILAIFRLAVCDYAGLAYGHDEPGRPRVVRSPDRAEAALFLSGWWARAMADWINVSGERIWREAQELRPLRCPSHGTGPAPAPLRVAGSRTSATEGPRRVA